jgi:hypothetical protein
VVAAGAEETIGFQRRSRNGGKRKRAERGLPLCSAAGALASGELERWRVSKKLRVLQTRESLYRRWQNAKAGERECGKRGESEWRTDLLP